MKKIVTILIFVLMCLGILVGCGQSKESSNSTVSKIENNSSTQPKSSSNISSSVENNTTVTSNGIIETTLVEGDVFEAVSSIDSSVELSEIQNPSKGINNLLIDIKPTEEDLENAFTTYLQSLKNITLQSYPVFVDKEYTHVLLRYCPTHASADLPGLSTFFFKLEPINDKYRLIPDSVGNTISEYITTLEKERKILDGPELSDDDLNCILKAIEKEKITELYDIE